MGAREVKILLSGLRLIIQQNNLIFGQNFGLFFLFESLMSLKYNYLAVADGQIGIKRAYCIDIYSFIRFRVF